MYLDDLSVFDLKLIRDSLVYYVRHHIDPLDYEAANHGDDYFKDDKKRIDNLLRKIQKLIRR